MDRITNEFIRKIIKATKEKKKKEKKERINITIMWTTRERNEIFFKKVEIIKTNGARKKSRQ